MEQQTAVEWLVEFIQDHCIIVDEKIIKFAKQKEKEQIMNAYWNGTTDMDKADALLMAEDYFNDYYSK